MPVSAVGALVSDPDFGALVLSSHTALKPGGISLAGICMPSIWVHTDPGSFYLSLGSPAFYLPSTLSNSFHPSTTT